MEIFELIAAHWDMLSTLVSLAALSALLYLQRIFVRRQDCESCRKEMESRCDGLEIMQAGYSEGRAAMTQQLAAMPKATDVQDLKVVIERLSGDIRTVRAEIKGQGEMLKAVKSQGDRMNGYLLEKR
jgi:outer membrane murein-binding lipoprotein Lpp